MIIVLSVIVITICLMTNKVDAQCFVMQLLNVSAVQSFPMRSALFYTANSFLMFVVIAIGYHIFEVYSSNNPICRVD